MTPEQIRQLIKEELEALIKSDRIVISKPFLHLLDGTFLILGTDNGTKIGTAASQKLGFWGATPMTQPNSAAAITGITVYGSGTAVNDQTLIHGDVGSRAYTLGDIVKNLKDSGILASS